MAKIYTVRSNGKIFKIRGPEGATPEQLQAASQQGQSESLPETPKESSFLDTLRKVNEFTPGGQLVKARENIGGIADMLGGKIAELPEQQNMVGELARANPTATGLAAGAVSTAPDIAEAVLGGGGGVKGMRLGKSALKKAFTSKGIGSQIGELEAAAGITKQLPSTKGLAQEIGLKKGSNFSDVANDVEQLIDAGVDIPKQFMSDFRVAAKKALNSEAFRSGEPRAILARIKGKADDFFNEAVKGRGKLAQKFKGAKGREEALKKALGVGKTAAKGAAILGLGGLGAKLLGGR